MDYKKEIENLQKDNAVNVRITVYIYENKEECLQELSVNADEPQETYEFMKEELAYLDDEKTIYSVDLGNGMPTYYDDEKEAYDSMQTKKLPTLALRVGFVVLFNCPPKRTVFTI